MSVERQNCIQFVKSQRKGALLFLAKSFFPKYFGDIKGVIPLVSSPHQHKDTETILISGMVKSKNEGKFVQPLIYSIDKEKKYQRKKIRGVSERLLALITELDKKDSLLPYFIILE